ncbi:MAG TPA: hypothetical protein VEP66_03405 [Myxococcales bacterium]|nr:hypothetical protein [Myxococcales bacterium]
MRRMLMVALAACAHAAPGPPGFGRSRERAAEVCLIAGAKIWLGGLRCPDGAAPQTSRIGSVGSRTTPADPNDPRILLQMDPERRLQPGEADFHIVDAFEARCAAATYTLFVDMYHCPAATPPAADGFTLE